MKVYRIDPQGFAANSYLVTEDGKTAFAVDPAQPRVKEEADRLGLRVEAVLLTHGHFDHIGGCASLQASGAVIGCLSGEEETVIHRHLGDWVPPFHLDFTVRDGERLRLAGLTVTVLATPGHTSGSACYLLSDALFTGDTLFFGNVGRTDLPTGSEEDLCCSLLRLRALEGDLHLYPGHGRETTLMYEKEHNGWLKC